MKAIILAAGFSTRLYPLTLTFPKALLPIGNKVIMQFMLEDLLVTGGIDEIVLVTNTLYLPHFQKWLATFDTQKRITILDNGTTSKDHRLGAIGDLQFTLEKTGWSDDLLVLPSDTLVSASIKSVINFFQNHRGFVNVIFDTHDKSVIAGRLGCAILDGITVTQFVEKPADPPTTLTSVPYYLYPKDALELIKEYIASGGSVDAPGSIIPWLIGKMPVYAYKIEKGYYFDVGTVEMYNKLKAGFQP